MSRFVSVLDFDGTLTAMHTWQAAAEGTAGEMPVAPRSVEQALQYFGGTDRLAAVVRMLAQLAQLGDILILTRSEEEDVRRWFALARVDAPRLPEPTRIVGRSVLGVDADAKARVVQMLLTNGSTVGYVDDSATEVAAVRRCVAKLPPSSQWRFRAYTAVDFEPVAPGGRGGLAVKHMEEVVAAFATHATLAVHYGL